MVGLSTYPLSVPQASIEKVLELACLAVSVGLSQPWRFILVDDPLRRAAGRRNFETCNAKALAGQEPKRAVQYARLKLAGLDDAPCHLAVFADRDTAARGHGLGRQTMPEMSEYSAVALGPTPSLAGRQTARTRLIFPPSKIIAPVEALAAVSVPQSSNAATLVSSAASAPVGGSSSF
jgi:Nitroreductase family